jgi:hypothetical protein
LQFDGTNLGIGATPASWTTVKPLQLGTNASVWSDGTRAFIGNNVYSTGVGTYKYIASSTAQFLDLAGDGSFQFYQVATGSANATFSPTQAMTLDNSGKLVIGSTTANAKLNVNTTSYSAVTNGEQVLIEGTTAWQQGLAFSIWGAGTYNSGYASGYIGAPNVPNQLYISGGAAVIDNTASYGWAKALNTTSASFIVVGNGGTYFYGNTGLTANTAYTPTQLMALDTSGNLLVGLASSKSINARLQVKRTDATNGALTYSIGWFQNATGDEDGLNILVTDQTTTIAADYAGINHGTSLVFATNNSAGPFGAAERARINSSGGLLVGSTSWVSGSSYQAGGIQIGGSTYAGIFGQTSGTTRYGLAYDNANTYLTVTSGGTLYVYNNSGGVYLSSGGTSWTAVSDERLKDIIEPISDAVNKLSSLRTVIGKYKIDADGTRRSFLIAQDVQAVFPEAVTEAQSKDQDQPYLGLQYTDIIPLLVASIKELNTLVTTQSAEIAALKQKVGI